MELRHFRYFAAVAEHLNYSEAARRLHVAQPAISQTVLDLEAELEVKLLLRTKRSVQLTAAGRIFLREAEAILRRAEEAKRLAQRAARGEVGTLSLAFIGPAIREILPSLLRAYQKKYPEVSLQMNHLNPVEQIAALDEGTIDLAFSRPLPPERRVDFTERKLYDDYLAVVLPESHPLAKEKKVKLEKLAAEPFILFHRPGAPGLFDETVATCRKAGFAPRVVHEPTLIATVFTMVESGLGVSLLPGCSCSMALGHYGSVVRPLAVRSDPISLCAAWSPKRDNPALDAFLEMLWAKAPAIRKQMGVRAWGK